MALESQVQARNDAIPGPVRWTGELSPDFSDKRMANPLIWPFF